MRVIEPEAEIIFPQDPAVLTEMVTLIESAARTCYKAEGQMGNTFNPEFIRSKIDMGHLSVTEHSLVTVRFICDRGVSHEIVRHRIASYSQESTRYCNFAKDKFGNEITVIKPCFWEEDSDEYCLWHDAMLDAEKGYFRLLEAGASPQEARSVLPNSLKTEIIVSMNFREWRHFFQLRAIGTTGKPHPQMKQLAAPLLKTFKQYIPVIFDDLEVRA